MDEKLTAIWEKIKSFFGNMTKATKIALAILLAVIAIIFFSRWVIQQTRPYETIFYDLSTSDVKAVTTALAEAGFEDFHTDGNDILAHASIASAARAAVYMEGLPYSGTGYPTYEQRVGTMSTDTDKTIAYVHDLQDNLSATIRNFKGVKEAEVYIAEGEDYKYVLDSANTRPTTASVYVTLESGQALDKDVAVAIRVAVAHAVSDLEIDYVAITDNMGNIYSNSTTGYDAVSDATALKLQLEEDINNKIRVDVLWALEGIYGSENLRVVVRSEVDVDRKYINMTEYPMPEDWLGENGGTDGRGILNTEVWNNYAYGPEGGWVGGLVGANVNSDIPMYPYDTDGDGIVDTYGGSSGQVDYLNPETTTQVESLAGTLTDIYVQVSINTNAENSQSVAVEDLVRTIGTASGIGTLDQAEKVNVLFGPFQPVEELEPASAGIASWMLFAILAGLALFIIVAIIIVILLRRKKRDEEERAAQEEEERRLEAERAAAEIAALETPVDGADIMDLNTEKSMELRKDLRTFVGNNPEIAAALLKNLMKGGETVAP